MLADGLEERWRMLCRSGGVSASHGRSGVRGFRGLRAARAKAETRERWYGAGLPADVRHRRRGTADASARHYQRQGKPAGRTQPCSHGSAGGLCRMGPLAGAASASGEPQNSLLDLAGLLRADRSGTTQLPRNVMRYRTPQLRESARIDTLSIAASVAADVSSCCGLRSRH